jgi:hypothetical protein
MLNLILLTYSFITLSLFLLIWCEIYGIQKTISDFFYKLKMKWVFQFVLASVSIPMLIVGHTQLMYIAGGLLLFVAFAPYFKDELESKVHVFGATGSIIVGNISLITDFGMWYIPVINVLFTGLATLAKFKNYTFWIEYFNFFTIMYVLYISRTI